MITWRDEAALLATRPFGESAVIIDVFSAEHGLHAGVVRGGTSRKIAPMLQPGAQLSVTWKARLDSHLGSFTVEPVRSRAAVAMADRLALAGLNAVCTLLVMVLPEREPQSRMYTRTIALLDLLGQSDVWPLAYLRWEQALLEATGFGMDLSACAVRGTNEVWVARDGKLAKAEITILRSGRSQIVARGDFQTADQLVLTRLATPMSGMKVETVEEATDRADEKSP